MSIRCGSRFLLPCTPRTREGRAAWISDSSDWGAVEGSDLVPLVHRENQRPIARRKLDLHTGPYQDRVTLAVPTG